ncbi:MAG: hypothetical protein KAI98_07985, partial [Gemmatimonadetes bacterium]|nr:hypothetical protein [Gemmatimonadota bacterium]
TAQTMPAPVYYELTNNGYERLANRISKKLEWRADPDDEDVQSLLDRWEREEGGPDSGWDHVAVARLWLRAGRAAEAEMALMEAEASGEVPVHILLLDQARVAFMNGQRDLGAEAYWKGCSAAGETEHREYWLDIESLATPDEVDAWNRLRTLPAADRNACAFFRRLWNRRAAASGMAVDERILAHYARTRYALDHYRRRGRDRPRFSVRLGRPADAVYDDRGLLYVRMGAPDEVAAHVGSICIEANVSWAYERSGGFRVYHLSPLGGTDDWYLLENLAMVYRCGTWDRNPMVAISPPLLDIPGQPFHDLYMSRMGLDAAYARIATYALNFAGDDFAGSRLAAELMDERKWTWADGEYAVATVPERPPVDLSVNFGLEWLSFRAPRPGLTRIWMNSVVQASTLTPEPRDGRDVYRVEAVWTLLDESESSYSYIPASFELSTDTVLDEEAGLSIRMSADLPPGPYRWMLMVAEANTTGEEDDEKPAGGYATGDLVVRNMGADLPLLSDVAVSPDSMGAWSPVRGISLNPTPAHVTGSDGIAFIYYEAYNLTPGGRYDTRVVLEPEGGGQAFDLSYPGTAQTGGQIVTRGYLRIDLSDSSPGRYRMSVTVHDLTSGITTLPVRTEIFVNLE